jgi:hypothetical protein
VLVTIAAVYLSLAPAKDFPPFGQQTPPPSLPPTPIPRADEVSIRGGPALQVEFRDGAKGQVDVTIRYQVIVEMAPWVVASFGGNQNAERQLIAVVTGNLLSELETHSKADARQSRANIGKKVVEDLRERIKAEFGYMLHGVDIGEIH